MGASRDDIVAKHGALVRRIATGIAKSYRVLHELDDLVSCGLTGLVESYDRYDADTGVPFQGYAAHRIRGAILDCLRREARLAVEKDRVRRHAQACLATERLHERMEAEGDYPTGFDSIVDAVDEGLAITAASVIASALADAEARDDPETLLGDRQQLARLRGAVDRLPERERVAIVAIYFEQKTFEEVAEIIQKSKATAVARVTYGLELLRELLR